jgi:quercetin dioxygenase-like cupin family protein
VATLITTEDIEYLSMRRDGRVDPHPLLSSDQAVSQRFPPVKIRAASLESVQARAVHHQSTDEIVKDLLKYNEVPGITNFSQVALRPGDVIARHFHPSKYEIFFVQSGTGTLHVWPQELTEGGGGAREVIDLKPGVTVAVGPEEPHEITHLGDTTEPLIMLYFGIVAPDSPTWSPKTN